MKKIFAMTLLATLPLAAMAQYEEGSENGVVSLAGREGFSIQTKKADFVFKPYLLVQTAAHINWYDDEGLDKAYNQDNLANSGFAVPYAVLGFTGKAWGKVSFNLSINAAASGGAILQQAWIDVAMKEAFAVRRFVHRSKGRVPDGGGHHALFVERRHTEHRDGIRSRCGNPRFRSQ